MANLRTPNLDWLKSIDPQALPGDFGQRLWEIVTSHQKAINATASQTNATAIGSTPAPPQISAVNVVGNANGVFDVQIQDNNPVQQGINYFVEYSQTPNFAQPYVLDLGPSRNVHVNLGTIALYFRAYSQYRTSPTSAAVYFGPSSSPLAVTAGGSSVPQTYLQPSTGSGSASNT